MVLEKCWNKSKNDLLVLAYYASFTDFRKRTGYYFRTKRLQSEYAELSGWTYVSGHILIGIV